MENISGSAKTLKGKLDNSTLYVFGLAGSGTVTGDAVGSNGGEVVVEWFDK
jgi:hypothetical protein